MENKISETIIQLAYQIWDFTYAKIRTVTPAKFLFKGNEYSYFYHHYNTTWKTERAVEIPIIWKIYSRFVKEPKTILEIGNVLSHYHQIEHDVIDKYEKANSVINRDIVNFTSGKKYKLIISISTLEHVGFDEEPKEPEKCLRAIENIKKLLDKGGVFVFTIPVGYNKNLDKLIKTGKIKTGKFYGLRRISQQEWIERDWKETIENSKYGNPYPFGNGVIIGIIKTS